jgi:hypothetical protein
MPDIGGDAFGALAEDFDTAGEASGDLTSRFNIQAAASSGLDVATNVLGGSTQGLFRSIVPQAAIFGGITASLIGLVHAGDRAVLSKERMDRTFGSSAPDVFDSKIGGMNLTLTELNERAGTSNTGLRMALATFGDMAVGAGATQGEAAKVAKQMGFVANVLTTLNPELGTADKSFQMISRGLGGSTRILQRYGITIDKVKQDQMALEIATDHGREKVSLYDRQVAGIQLTMEQFRKKAADAGMTLDEFLGEALDNSTIKFRALKQQVNSALSEIGVSLVDTGLTISETFTPIITNVIDGVGKLADIIAGFPVGVLQAIVYAFLALAAIKGTIAIVHGIEAATKATIAWGTETAKAISLATRMTVVQLGLSKSGQALLETQASMAVATKASNIILGARIAIFLGLAAAIFAVASELGIFKTKTMEVDTSIEHLAKTSLPKLALEIETVYNNVKAAQAPTKELSKLLKQNLEVATGDVSAKTVAYAQLMKDLNKTLEEAPGFAALYIDAMEKKGYSTAEATDLVERHTKAEGKARAASSAHAEVVEQIADPLGEMAKAYDEAAASTQSYIDSAFAVFDAQFALADSGRALEASMKKTAETAEEQKVLDQERQQSILALSKAAGERAVQELGPEATATEKVKAGYEAQVVQLEALKLQYPAMIPFIDLFLAKLKEEEANGSNANIVLDNAVDALTKLRDKYPELTKPINDLIKKIEEEKIAFENNDITIAGAIDMLKKLAEKYPKLREEIRLLIEAIKEIKNPPPVVPVVDIEPAKALINKLILYSLAAFEKIRNAFTSGNAAGGGAFPGFAAGGSIPPGPFWVGEKGPELMFPAFSGRIISHQDSLSAISAGVKDLQLRGRKGPSGSSLNAPIVVNVTPPLGMSHAEAADLGNTIGTAAQRQLASLIGTL